MIRAVTQNSREGYVEFKKFNLYKKDRMTLIIGPILLLVLGGLFVMVNFVFSIVLLGLAILLPPFLILSMKLTTKKFLKNGHDYLSTATKFEFQKDAIRVTSVSPKPEQCVEGTVRYDELYCAYETPVYFYLYLTKTSCLILPKLDVTLGTAEELSELLKSKLQPLRKYMYRK